MAGLAGIIYRKNPQIEYKYNYKQTVNEILKKISHRGRTNKKIFEIKNKKYNTVLGLISKCDINNKKINDKKIKKFNICLDGKIYNIDRLYKKYNSKTLKSLKTAAKSDDEKLKNLISCFGPEVIGEFKGAFALIYNDKENNIFIARDFLGRKPLYYSYNKKAGSLLFASEVKALTNYCNNINEVPPGSILKNISRPKIIKDINIKNYSLSNFDETQNECINETEIAEKIDTLLHLSIERRINKKSSNQRIGVWLSGGMDSSIIAAVLKNFTDSIYTFSVGFENSKDIEASRAVSKYLGTKHTEFILKIEDLFNLIPKAVYTLESFDAPLVRSTLGNIIISELSSKSDTVFSGEGGDEIFAGYNHFLNLNSQYAIQHELIKSLKSLHNTALQRVDRSSNLFNINIRLPMLDEDLIECALHIPPEYKINYGRKLTKYILRVMASKYLPDFIVWRPKDKFWEGSGIYNKLQKRIELLISDKEFEKNKKLASGFVLRNKEEFYYYKIFREYFPSVNYRNFLSFTKNFS